MTEGFAIESREAMKAASGTSGSPGGRSCPHDFNIIRLQGTTLDSGETYVNIATELGLLEGGKPRSEARALVLKRFRSAVQPRRKTGKSIPLTILVIDEIDKAPKPEMRELLAIAGHDGTNEDQLDGDADGHGDGDGSESSGSSSSRGNGSSLIVIGLANSIRFPDDLDLPYNARPAMVLFECYDSSSVQEIILARGYGLFHPMSANLVSKKVAGKSGKTTFVCICVCVYGCVRV